MALSSFGKPVAVQHRLPLKQPSFLDSNLTRRVDNNFRYISMAGYLPGDADVPVAIQSFRPAELRPVRSPNHNCENLFWIWHIEVHKRGQTFRLLGKMNASNSPTNSGGLTHMVFCFCRSQLFCLCLRDAARHEAKHQQQCCSESSHNGGIRR